MDKPVTEPVRASFSSFFTLYFFATRPAFLSATLAACMLGLASAAYSGVAIQPLIAVIAVLLALLVHAGVNVLNDYFDALNGTDAGNVDRLYPFTGGSRFIQNGVLTLAQTMYFGYLLLAAAMLGGLWLAFQLSYGLLLLGMVGMLVGWAYSASPLRLNSRGLGELCVLLGFLGIVIGTDFVQRRSFSFEPLIVGMPYALLVTNLLYINQFPDRKADARAGKHNLVVRLPLSLAVWFYFLLAVLALLWITVMIFSGHLPELALLSALPLLLSARAFWLLRQFATKPEKLLPAIKLTLASMLSHALLLTLIMLWNTP
ncbi:MAG TPA: prenyltransferase [Methylotenera sp.]|jgi:1,4-dihydroxy-2-naphthoate octaprenyltransferase